MPLTLPGLPQALQIGCMMLLVAVIPESQAQGTCTASFLAPQVTDETLQLFTSRSGNVRKVAITLTPMTLMCRLPVRHAPFACEEIEERF